MSDKCNIPIFCLILLSVLFEVFMNLEKMIQELSKCKNKNEIKKLLQNRRNARDLYLVQTKSLFEYKKLRIF